MFELDLDFATTVRNQSTEVCTQGHHPLLEKSILSKQATRNNVFSYTERIDQYAASNDSLSFNPRPHMLFPHPRTHMEGATHPMPFRP